MLVRWFIELCFLRLFSFSLMIFLKIYFLPLDLPFFRRNFLFCWFPQSSVLFEPFQTCLYRKDIHHTSCPKVLWIPLQSFIGICFVVALLCNFPIWKYCLFQEFVLFLPLVSDCGTACPQLEPYFEQSFYPQCLGTQIVLVLLVSSQVRQKPVQSIKESVC